VQRKDEDEQMIGHRLQVSVEGMKGVGCEGSWDCGRDDEGRKDSARKNRTYSTTCGAACEHTCKLKDGATRGVSSRCRSQ
jgi:hypothetical protein